MAALDTLLDGPRAQRAFVMKAMFDGDWCISVEDQAPLSVVVMAKGEASFREGGTSHRVVAGDLVLLRGPAPYCFSDSEDREPTIRILPGQVCVDPHGQIVPQQMHIGVRSWGNTVADEATVMLVGTYQRETSVGALLLSRLPTSMVLRTFDASLVDLLASELDHEESGQRVVLDRLLDLVTVHAIRAALSAGAPRPTDDAVARAIGAIEEYPDRPWTVAALGTHVGLSRAALARRFNRHVGMPPLAYLTRWRLALAADLLIGTDLTLTAIAGRVGYANPFSLSAAFKRLHGVPPAEFRANADRRDPSSTRDDREPFPA